MSSYEVTFLKEDSSLDMKLEILKGLSHTNKEELYLLERGVKGEKEVLYYLKKSGMGMYVMRDVNFALDDLKAQVDFIIVTSHHCYFVECKNYSTEKIYVDHFGNFEIKVNNRKKAIKSPLSQVDDQLSVFKKICLKEEDVVKNLLCNNKFNDYFKTIVVFSNPENALRLDEAPQDIKYRILKVDNLVRQIEYDKKHFKGSSLSKEQVEAVANYILSNNVQPKIEDAPIIEEPEIIEQPKLKSSTKKEDTITSSILKEAKTGMINIIKTIIGCFILIVIASLLTRAISPNTKNNTNNSVSENKLTDSQINAINTFKSAYQNSKQKGFDIIDTSVCKEISSVLNNKMLCDKDPIRVNITDNKIRIHKSFYCYNIELGKNEDTLVDAHQVSGFVYSTDQCFEGEKVALGVVEMDESNEYCQKIGGLQKIKDMATYSFVNDAMLDNYYDSSHVVERGGNDNLYTTYKMKVDMYFSSITGKSYNGMAASNTYKDTTNEMCESLYYIMK